MPYFQIDVYVLAGANCRSEININCDGQRATNVNSIKTYFDHLISIDWISVEMLNDLLRTHRIEVKWSERGMLQPKNQLHNRPSQKFIITITTIIVLRRRKKITIKTMTASTCDNPSATCTLCTCKTVCRSPRDRHDLLKSIKLRYRRRSKRNRLNHRISSTTTNNSTNYIWKIKTICISLLAKYTKT